MSEGFNLLINFVFSFRFTNPLDFCFQVPLPSLWLTVPRGCNKERRKRLNYFAVTQSIYRCAPVIDFQTNSKRKSLYVDKHIPERI